MRTDRELTKAGMVFPELVSCDELAGFSAAGFKVREAACRCHLSGQLASILTVVALAAAVARALAELI